MRSHRRSTEVRDTDSTARNPEGRLPNDVPQNVGAPRGEGAPDVQGHADAAQGTGRLS